MPVVGTPPRARRHDDVARTLSCDRSFQLAPTRDGQRFPLEMDVTMGGIGAEILVIILLLVRTSGDGAGVYLPCSGGPTSSPHMARIWTR